MIGLLRPVGLDGQPVGFLRDDDLLLGPGHDKLGGKGLRFSGAHLEIFNEIRGKSLRLETQRVHARIEMREEIFTVSRRACLTPRAAALIDGRHFGVRNDRPRFVVHMAADVPGVGLCLRQDAAGQQQYQNGSLLLYRAPNGRDKRTSVPYGWECCHM